MRRMVPRRRRWLTLVVLILISSAVTVRVHSQLDSHGFLSIDCGLPPNSTYVETETNLTYVSDEQFVDTGNISQISSSYVSENPAKEFLTVRYFPTGARNCYTINSLIIGFKYLIRGLFIYGNYDGLNQPPIFDIYLGVSFWYTVNTSSPSYPEIIISATDNYLHVCLVNNGLGIPFISSLHLRQVKKDHLWVNATQSLISLYRLNLGASDRLVRYPDDLYDRWWWSYTKRTWEDIYTTSTIALDSDFDTPSRVMQTAATTSSIEEPLFINMTADKKLQTFYVLHFAEIQDTLITDLREFNISVRGYLMDKGYIPSRQSSIKVYIDWSVTDYSISLVATSNSTLPPLLNAIELYKLIIPLQALTDGGDVSAINTIKEEHQIKKGWSGDPCIPIEFKWSGIDCTSNSSNISRITGLDLSSSNLTGPLSDYFGKLFSLESLDLSNNDLSGSLPASLSQLTALTYLDIRGNDKMSTALPLGLQTKLQDGNLIYRFDEKIPTPSPSPSPSSKRIVIIIVIAVVVVLLVIAVAIAIVWALKRTNHNPSIIPKPNESYESDPLANNPAQNNANITETSQTGTISLQSKGDKQVFPNFQTRQFSYEDLSRITDGFKNNIGTGGYGSVYLGMLENEVQVAVKMRSHSSKQGVKEFLAEAENLTRVHHRNLVALMGYCIDTNCMALVYEYMQEGNLHDKLQDNGTPLTWRQRLCIAYESALGLEYLHKACNPPLIHRDVKTSNILLSANLEAKIADFGLSRAFNNDAPSHVSTRVVGTPGYLDPEYYTSNQLSAKSDVFSFGVVLLEIITSRPPIIVGLQGSNLVQWVNLKLSEGDIESIVDPRMQDRYEVNSVWKVTDLACKCTNRTSSERPTMTVVVAELKESLDLEIISRKEMCNDSSAINLVTDISQDSISHMAYMSDMSVRGPSVR